MSQLTLPSRFLDQPQHPVELSSEYAVPGALAYLGGQRALIGRGNYAEAGTIVSEPCMGGVGSRGNTTSSYINAGKVIHAQPGRFMIVAQFIALDATMRYLQGNVANGSQYIEDMRCNSNQSETTAAGKIAMQFRAQDGAGAQVHAATTSAVHDVGHVCTVAWEMVTATSLRCAVNGKVVPISYSVASTYSAPESLTEFPLDLLNRNVRNAHSVGTGVHLLCYARLPIGGLDIEALSAEPYQIFEAPSQTIYFDLGAGGGITDAEMSAEGSSVVSLASQAIAKAAMSSAGAGVLSGAAQAIVPSALSSDGSAAASIAGQALFSSVITSAGLASVSFGGQSIATGAMSSDGVGATAWSSQSLFSATISVDSVSSASFVALASGFADAAVSASGVGAGAFTAQSITSSAISSVASGSALWVSIVPGFADASFAMAGIVAASLAAQAIAKASASSAGAGAAAFGAQTIIHGSVSAAGSSINAWSGSAVAGGALAIASSGNAAFNSQVVASGILASMGIGAATWVSADSVYSLHRTLLIASENRALLLDAQNRILAV
jgi:hypothetical protein